MGNNKTRWYKEAVVYQVYPFSFMDANNDGWGDIEGILSKLDYIKDLGVTAIWFSPMYVSPDHDYGYDISDYYAIDEKFGTMEDFDRLLRACHERGLKVIMDMVINHTSTEHPWFKEAIADPNSPYRDYYLIRKGHWKGKKLLPPTNWVSTFTGSAWERIGDSEDFYLHLFCPEQADLNWENEKVREEIIKVLNFWLDKGVDGFRFDVFNMFSKVHPFQDDTDKTTYQVGAKYFVDGPRMHEFLKELNEKSLSLYDSYTVGEPYHPSEVNQHEYVMEVNGELDTIFSFEHMDSDNIGGLKFFKKPFNLRQFKEGFFHAQRQAFDGGWNTLVLENHDNPRSVSRFGIDTKHYRYEAATMLATLEYMGFGIPYIYMGQEIGMTNSDFGSIEELKDPVSHFVYNLMRHYGMPKGLAFSFIKYGARDHSRVPMQWDDSVNGGFNTGHKTWQSVNTNYKEINVKKDLASPRSIYRFYQRLLSIKKTNPVAIYGKTTELDHDNRKIMAYWREYEGKKLLVVGNFSKHPVSYALPQPLQFFQVLLNNYDEVEEKGEKLFLKPYQAIVFQQ